jgi:hypothetical protein
VVRAKVEPAFLLAEVAAAAVFGLEETAEVHRDDDVDDDDVPATMTPLEVAVELSFAFLVACAKERRLRPLPGRNPTVK